MNALKRTLISVAMLTAASATYANLLTYELSGSFATTFRNTSVAGGVNLGGGDFTIKFQVDTGNAPVSTNDNDSVGQENHRAVFASPMGEITISGTGGNDGTYAITAPQVTLINSYGTNLANDMLVFSGSNPTGLTDNLIAIQMTVDLGGQGVYAGNTIPDSSLVVTGVVLSEAAPLSPEVSGSATDPSPNSPSYLLETFFFGAPEMGEFIPEGGTLVPEANAAPMAALAFSVVLLIRRRKARQSAA